MKGYVYVLSNPSMPGLVKIGRTVRSVEGRANELYQTGVPTPFVVEHDVLSPNCAELEALAHAAFSEFRVGDGREFFRVSADEVRTFLDEGVFCQLEDFVLEYSEDYGVALEPFILSPYDVGKACEGVDIHPYEFSSVVAFLSPDAIRDAYRLYREFRVKMFGPCVKAMAEI